jgi:signal transduction histidine kinase
MLSDPSVLDRPDSTRLASYLWVGLLGIGLFILLAIGIGHSFSRQLRLTRLKTDLVAAVSHELRTPLASMRLLVDALLRDQQLDPVKTREYLDLIAVENGRLSRLIDNFLTFSRLERNRHRFSFETIRPEDVVEAAVGAMRERLHPGCVVDVQISPGLPSLVADADGLVTALLNLLDNAYKYTPAEKRIVLRAFQDAGHVVFTVQDNGIGIPAGEQKRIFRRFYRVDRRLARETSGVGLGLSIVHEIVKAHGGTIHVSSHAGEGSTFTVRVPIAAAAAGAQA